MTDDYDDDGNGLEKLPVIGTRRNGWNRENTYEGPHRPSKLSI